MASTVVGKTTIGVTATPEEFDPRHRRGRKPYQGDDAAMAREYFRGVNDGTEYTHGRLIEIFEEEERNVEEGLFSIADIRRIIRREEV